MQEAHIDHSELDRLTEKMAQAPEVLARAKRQAFEASATKMKATVDREIGGSGRVQSWQEKCVGSGGGYAAVRAKKKTYVETKGRQKGFRSGPKKYAVGYITNAVNSGHRAPRNKYGDRPSGRTVAGRHFYELAATETGAIAREAAEQIVEALAAHWEG